MGGTICTPREARGYQTGSTADKERQRGKGACGEGKVPDENHATNLKAQGTVGL